MNTTSGFALKKGRLSSHMKIIPAAEKLHISDRTLKKYEKDQIKNKDPQIFAKAIDIYDDEDVGMAYLNEDPVFVKLFGRVIDTLLDKIIRKILNSMSPTIEPYFNANQRIAFAY